MNPSTASSAAARRTGRPAMLRTDVPSLHHAAQLAAISELSFPDPWSTQDFRTQLERPHTRALATLEPAGSVVGYALGWKVLDECELLSFAVHPRWRRRGVGAELLRAYFARLRAERARTLRLEVRASNLAAQSLYRELGMARCGERRRYYRDGETALLLSVDLQALAG